MATLLVVAAESPWLDGVAAALRTASVTVKTEADPLKALAALEASGADTVLVQVGGRRLAMQKLYGELGRAGGPRMLIYAPESVSGSAVEATPPAHAMRMPSRLAGREAATWVLEKMGLPVPAAWRLVDVRPVASLGTFALSLVRRAEGSSALVARLDESYRGDAASRKVFVEAARSAQAIRHPAVVATDEIIGADDVPVVFLGVPQGALLSEVLAREPGGRLPIPEAVVVMDAVLTALLAAHAAPGGAVFHGGLSPECAWVDEEGQVRVLLFGLARLAETVPARGSSGRLGVIRPYLDPEQLFGLAMDARTDQYRAAQLLYALVDGAPPFKRDTHFRTVEAIGRDPLPDLRAARPEVGEHLWRFMERALQRRPDDRFATLGEARTAFEAAVTEDLPQLDRAAARDALAQRARTAP